jgi:hypothetical protein
MRTILRPLLLAAAILVPASAHAQDTGIRALRAANARMLVQTRGIQNYTMVMKSAGQTLTLYLSRPDTASPFTLQFGSSNELTGLLGMMIGSADVFLSALEGSVDEAAATLRYQGVSAEAGGPAHVFAAPDSSGVVLTIHYDTVTFLPRRVIFGGPDDHGGVSTITVDLSDWRPVRGMMVAYRRHVVARGMRALVESDGGALGPLIDGARSQMATLAGDERVQAQQLVDMLQGLQKRNEIVADFFMSTATVNAGPPAGVHLESLSDEDSD